MTPARFAELLAPLAGAVFVGGWALAIVAFLVIGTERCADVRVPLAGAIKVCQDATSSTVLLIAVIGFLATIGSLILLGMRYLLLAVADIHGNTKGQP
jgi:hypothetical protein